MIKVSIKGIPEIKEFLNKVALGFKNRATYAVAEYLIGDESHGLKHAPYYKYINRYAGFPEAGGFYENYKGKPHFVPLGYHSVKQFKYVMWAISQGIIKPGQDNRTGNLQDNWQIGGEAPRYVLENKTSYAGYVQGNQQTRMHSLIGWRRFGQVIKDNWNGAMRHANQAIARLLKESK